MGRWCGEKHVTGALSAYVERALSPKEQGRVERHLARCSACQQALTKLEAARLALKDVKVNPSPESLWKRIETRLPTDTAIVSQNALFMRHQAEVRQNRLQRSKGFQRFAWTTAFAACTLMLTSLRGDVRKKAGSPNSMSDTQPTFSASWKVDRLRGTPSVGSKIVTTNARLKVGDRLVTGSGDSARVEVADIGQVEVAPNSCLRLVKTQNNLHRLALDRGELSAKVLAPPRLFLVDTPSAVAVDLGCAYTLHVDSVGDTRLQVTTGRVALENGTQTVEVPAAAICRSVKGVGTGTPFFVKAPAQLKVALQRFDFEKGGDTALTIILKTARLEDTLTLFYLLPRVSSSQRERVINCLLTYIAFPEGVTRAGIRKLDRTMLEDWKAQMEFYWY